MNLIHNQALSSITKWRKTFVSPLANHFSAVMQNSLLVDIEPEIYNLDPAQERAAAILRRAAVA